MPSTAAKPDGKLIDVTAIMSTKAGDGINLLPAARAKIKMFDCDDAGATVGLF